MVFIFSSLLFAACQDPEERSPDQSSFSFLQELEEDQDFSVSDAATLDDDARYTCTLTSQELAARKSLLQEQIFPFVQSIEELPNGFQLHFKDHEKMASKIVEFMLLEKECCSFFGFQFEIRPFGKGLSLTIGGSRLSKQFIRYQLRSMGLET